MAFFCGKEKGKLIIYWSLSNIIVLYSSPRSFVTSTQLAIALRFAPLFYYVPMMSPHYAWQSPPTSTHFKTLIFSSAKQLTLLPFPKERRNPTIAESREAHHYSRREIRFIFTQLSQLLCNLQILKRAAIRDNDIEGNIPVPAIMVSLFRFTRAIISQQIPVGDNLLLTVEKEDMELARGHRPIPPFPSQSSSSSLAVLPKGVNGVGARNWFEPRRKFCISPTVNASFRRQYYL